MAKCRRRNNRRAKAEMNVVPYIDVMLVLLVIFMITAPLIQQSIKVDLPSVGSGVASVDETDDLTLPLVLTVDAAGAFYLNVVDNPSDPLTEGEVREAVQSYLHEHPTIDIYVRGDGNATYSQVMTGFEFLQQAGAEKVHFSTQSNEEESQ